MAKQPTSKSGSARIRFIMLDAEIPDGDLSQITTAIQNALKPAAVTIQQRLAATPSLPSGAPSSEAHSNDEPVETITDEETVAEVSAARSARSARPRQLTVPKVLELELTSGTSFEAFAREHMPKNDRERNLVVLAWFKKYRPEETVTANHVYTCYRAVGWPSGIEDFSGPLRSLKKDQLITSPSRGHYVINHLGNARVEKMGAAS